MRCCRNSKIIIIIDSADYIAEEDKLKIIINGSSVSLVENQSDGLYYDRINSNHYSFKTDETSARIKDDAEIH